jgi:hypothetical protein
MNIELIYNQLANIKFNKDYNELNEDEKQQIIDQANNEILFI